MTLATRMRSSLLLNPSGVSALGLHNSKVQ